MDDTEFNDLKGNKNTWGAGQERMFPEHPQRPFDPKNFGNNNRNDRYNNAYGDYSGGYGPPGGGYGQNFRPPRYFGPRGYFPIPNGPPPVFYQGPYGPPGPHGPPGPQGPPGNFMWGRGFGPEGPPIRRQPMDDKTIRYLLRCGVAKDQLKNLPRDLLQLMEPEYCGLCAQSFESFAVSRTHYISKNHIKNQKKWLTQPTEIGFRRAKEIPLKARELYCELCDVHITSKTHSESHYAGKSHRSIVEGRKNPKNPFLLQQGMQGRVQQLIRREKKNLKPTTEEDEAVEKDAKVVQPDLHCEICKTSVTCSEQMTMHLNGKRHLSKEKQHILKMMKGGGNATQLQETQNEDAAVEEIENAEEEEEEENEESYDWGKGEEKWEETSQNEWI
ncbi:uncharacterized protein LOC126779930 [Nymphalis io]|uniref:uncharacterized protein LOC126779930 n=1 Tax=Inachis io TaxID=171585 RepID=UPI002167BAE9|nr:uncharacterized protein LOC126779930 [Nymphalis io]